MRRWFTFLFVLLWITPAAATTYYASQAGGGNGLTSGTPFQIVNFWSVAKPGDTLLLLNGTYTGANSMIRPPQYMAGTASQPITVRALNPGQPWINGQGSNIPVVLGDNQWIVLEDFDASNGSEDVVRISHGGNNTLRRICAWDADGNSNSSPIVVQYATNNLLEDMCGFGIGRKIFHVYESNNTTVRRAWGEWSDHPWSENGAGSPKHTFNGGYNSYGAIWENVIGTWDGYAVGAYGVLGSDGFYQAPAGTDFCTNYKYLGSIGYLKTGATIPSDLYGVGFGTRSADCIEFKDSVFDAGTSNRPPIYGMQFDGGAPGLATCGASCDRKFTNTTEIGSASSVIYNLNSGADGWTSTNRLVSATVPTGTTNIWNGSSSSGARVCYRYVDGQPTTTPLWPWPMDARIRQALTRSGRNPDTYFGGTGNGLTDLMIQRYGSIPTTCRSDAASGFLVGITAPTSNPTYTTSSNTINLSGTSTQLSGTVTWENNRGGSGTATGTTTWSITGIALLPGENGITVRGTDQNNVTAIAVLTVTYAPAPPGNALVAGWALSEGSGGTTANSTANTGINATLVNGASWLVGEGRYDSAIQLDPNNSQHLLVNDANVLDFTHTFALSLWVKPAATHLDWRAAIVKNYMIALYASQIGVASCGSGFPVVWFRANGVLGPDFYACGTSVLNPNSWNHLAATYDGTNLRLYVNGQNVTTTPATGYIESSTENLQIGASRYGEYFDGAVDEVRIYNWAIPATTTGNTKIDTACNVEEYTTPSIIGDANCPIIPFVPPPTFWIGASSTFALGAGATFEIGQSP